MPTYVFFKVIKSLEGQRSKPSLIIKRTVYGCVAAPEVKDSEIANLFDKKRLSSDMLLQVREARKEILEGVVGTDFAKGIYDNGGWYNDEVRAICRDWFSSKGVTEIDSGGDKGWLDINNKGVETFVQCKVMAVTTTKENHENFSLDDNFGGKCKSICGRIPSSDILHEQMPKDIAYFSKIRPGVHEKKLPLRLNTRILEKFLLPNDQKMLAEKIHGDPMSWTKKNICATEGEEKHSCIDGDCEICTFVGSFILQDESKNYRNILSQFFSTNIQKGRVL